jgi:hypothetical protein
VKEYLESVSEHVGLLESKTSNSILISSKLKMMLWSKSNKQKVLHNTKTGNNNNLSNMLELMISHMCRGKKKTHKSSSTDIIVYFM